MNSKYNLEMSRNSSFLIKINNDFIRVRLNDEYAWIGIWLRARLLLHTYSCCCLLCFRRQHVLLCWGRSATPTHLCKQCTRTMSCTTIDFLRSWCLKKKKNNNNYRKTNNDATNGNCSFFYLIILIVAFSVLFFISHSTNTPYTKIN